MPYIAFLYNVLVSLVDRYVAITRSVWHRRQLTRRRVIISKLIPEIVLIVGIKWFFILPGFVTKIECVTHVVAGDTAVGAGLVLFCLCLALLVVVYTETWKRLPRPARDIPLPPIIPPRRRHHRRGEQQEIEGGAAAAAVMNVHTSHAALRRIEIKVTRMFLTSLLPLFLLVLPGLVYSLSYLYCFHSDPRQSICVNLTPWLHHIEKIMSVHALVYPISNLVINKDLSSGSSRRPFWHDGGDDDNRRRHLFV